MQRLLRSLREVELTWMESPPKMKPTSQETTFLNWIAETLPYPLVASYYEQLILQAEMEVHHHTDDRPRVERKRVTRVPDFAFSRVGTDPLTNLPLFPLLIVELTLSPRPESPWKDPKINTRRLARRARIPSAIIYKDEEQLFFQRFKEERESMPLKDRELWLILARTVKWWSKRYENSKLVA